MIRQAMLLLILATATTGSIFGQRYFTREGHISFRSETPIQTIEAHNRSVSSVWDKASGRLEFAANIKAFQFENGLMQQHFNENYMESDKYPKATFKGQLSNPSAVNTGKDGQYTATVKGQLNIHGVSRDIQTNASFQVQSGKTSATASFQIALDDYGIDIPTIVRLNISNTVTIKVNVAYQPMAE